MMETRKPSIIAMNGNPVRWSLRSDGVFLILLRVHGTCTNYLGAAAPAISGQRHQLSRGILDRSRLGRVHLRSTLVINALSVRFSGSTMILIRTSLVFVIRLSIHCFIQYEKQEPSQIEQLEDLKLSLLNPIEPSCQTFRGRCSTCN